MSSEGGVKFFLGFLRFGTRTRSRRLVAVDNLVSCISITEPNLVVFANKKHRLFFVSEWKEQDVAFFAPGHLTVCSRGRRNQGVGGACLPWPLTCGDVSPGAVWVGGIEFDVGIRQ